MSKFYFVFLTLFLLFFHTVNAQNFQWAKGLGSASYDRGYGIKADNSNNIYITGYYAGITDFDPGPDISNLSALGGTDAFIAKYDPNGKLLWTKSIGGVGDQGGYSIAIDQSNNVYVSGWFHGTTDFDPGPGIANRSSIGQTDFFIAKYDSSGKYLWAKSGGSWEYDACYSITIDTKGNVYSTGYFYGTVDFDPGSGIANLVAKGEYDIFILKYDSNGNYLWAKSIGSAGSDMGEGVVVDGNSNVYVSGYFDGLADFDAGTGVANLTSMGVNDIFILKYDSKGNYLWAKCIGSAQSDRSYGIAIDAKANIFFTGYFTGSVDFDPGIGIANLSSGGLQRNIFFSKFDSSGNYIWAKSINSPDQGQGWNIAADSKSNVFVKGNFSGTADFDPDSGVFNLASQGMFISRYDTDGNYAWSKTAKAHGIFVPQGLAIDKLDNVYLVDYYSDVAVFDWDTLKSIGTTDICFAKIAAESNKKKQFQISGFIYNDINKNCIKDSAIDKPLKQFIVKAMPGPFYTFSDVTGNYTLTTDSGTFSISLIPPEDLKTLTTNCNNSAIVKTGGIINDISGIDFGVDVKSCTLLKVNITSNRLRRCLPSTAQVTYGNHGTSSASNVKVKVVFPDYLVPVSSKPHWTSKMDNVLTYDFGSMNSGSFGTISIIDSVICGIEEIRGLTQCIKAEIFPANSCDSVSTAWDKSSMKVTGACDNSQVKMVIKNAGSGSMISNSEFRVFMDNVLVKKATFKLNSGDSLVLMIPSQGKTVRLEADQHPKHPGHSRPRATIEACGSALSAASKGFFLDAPLDNGNADEQSTCLTIVDSYDPNDKSVIPSGGYIDSLQDLEYTIRFQNTGTDTAYNVVVVDTISGNLDIESFQNTGSSHNYKCSIEGKERTIKWSFPKINLPDSAANNPGSNGYVSYKIKQKTGNKQGVFITNKAFIYFDYNSAIITNETMNTVFDTVITDYSQGADITVSIVTSINESNDQNIRIYPNPAQNKIIVESTERSTRLIITNIQGQKVLEQNLEHKTSEINIGEIPAGVYFMKLEGVQVNRTVKLVIAK